MAEEKSEKSPADPDRTEVTQKTFRYLNRRLKQIATWLSAKEGRQVTLPEAMETVCADVIEEYYLEALAEEIELARQRKKNR